MVKELVMTMAKAIVDDVDAVDVHVIGNSQTQTTVVELVVAKSDVGKVIGKGGRIADAMRTVLGCVSVKDRKRYLLNVVDC